MIGERTKLAQPRRLVFLPGAGGDPSFWQPVADLLRERAKPVLLGWPGHAGLPLDSSIAGIGDLAELVLREMTSPCALVAQSMGGVVAMIAALRRPALVSHLVLVATSGGIDIADLRPADWRESFARDNPSLPRWFIDDSTDLTLLVPSIQCPTLLLWGDADPISPVPVASRLAGLLPDCRVRVFAGAGHDLARTHAVEVAREVSDHLQL